MKSVIHAIQRILHALAISLAVLVPASVWAATVTTAGSGNWNSTTANAPWPGGTVPAAGTDVVIASGHTVTITANVGNSPNSITINSGGELDIGGYTLTVNAGTSVSGTLKFVTSASGTKTFTGLVTINAGGAWIESVASTMTFKGGITATPTFFANTGVHTFNTASQTLTGTFSIPNVTVTGAAVALNNAGTLTVDVALAGTGGLTQNAHSTLNIGGTATITTLNATANTPNTVNYSGVTLSNGDQAVKAITYYNMIFSGTGTRTMATGTSVTGNLGILPNVTDSANTFGTKANITAGLNLSVGTLTLGGAGRTSGTWGSTTATSATHQNNTYFTATTGYLTVGSANVATVVDAGASKVTAFATKAPVGGSTTVTVLLKDASGNGVVGKTVTLARNGNTGAGTPTITPASVITSDSGAATATFTVSCSTAGAYDFEATDTTDSNLKVTQKATVTFSSTLVIGYDQFTPGAYNITPTPINAISTDLLQQNFAFVTDEINAVMRDGSATTPDTYKDYPFVTTYALNTASSPWGYDIKEIRLFAGQYSGRAGQSYDILYSLYGAPDTFIPLGTVLTPSTEYGTVMTRTYDSSAGSSPDAGTPILTGVARIRFNIRPLAGQSGSIWREIDVTGSASPPPPGITAGTIAGAVTTTYGTASATPTSFTVSGANMTAGILVTAPTGFEVSQSSGTGYGPTTTVGSAGTIASTPVYVRLAATAQVSGTYDSQNIVLSSSGAASVNVATASSGNTVAPAALTITANSQNKPFGATQTTPVSGSTAFTPVGLKNGDTVGTVTLTYGSGGLAPTDPVGSTSTITPSAATGGSFSAGNYSISNTPISGTLTVTAIPVITTTGTLSAVDTTYGTASASPTSFTVSGADMAVGITVTPPAGIEVSKTPGGSSGYAGSGNAITVGAVGTISSTTIYVRLAATATVVSSPYSGNVTCTSFGATEKDVATASSAVSPATLTITANNQDKIYGATQATPVTGSSAFTPVGLKNGETVGTVTLTYGSGGLLATDPVGSTSTITPSSAAGGTFTPGNYNIGYIDGMLAVTPGALDHFSISTITSPQTAGTPITGITLTALDANNNTLNAGPNAFNGTVTYSGTAGITGTAASFVNGVLSGVSVIPTLEGNSLTFVVTASGKSGTSTFNVNPTTAYYFDDDGATPGFGSPSGSYSLSGNNWSVRSAGDVGTVAMPASKQWTFGNVGSDLADRTFSINMDNSNAIGSILINSGSASVTLAGGGNNYPGSSWTVATGSTLINSMNYGGIGGMNWQGANTTFSGGGTIDFVTAPGMNARGAMITQSGPVVNMQASSGAGNFPYQANYTLTAGTLNFATAAGASAFVVLGGNSGTVTISGGTIDNTSGSAKTLDLNGGFGGQGIIKLGGNFIFAGSSDLSFGTTPVTLTATPQITVAAHNLTMGGIISGSGFGLTKAGAGTLTLNNTEAYTGHTTINAGTLVLGASGALNAASSVSIAAGGTFDVSALTASSATYTWNTASLGAGGTATAATIAGTSGGTLDMGTKPITLTWAGAGSGTDSTHPPLTVTGASLALSGNQFTVVTSAPLGVGVYTLVSAGTISGGSSVNATALYTGGSGLAGGAGGVVSISGNTVILTVTAGYSVTYDANNATSGTVPSDGNTYAPADTVTVLGNTGSLAKTGLTFTGWNSTANGGGTHYGATFVMGSSNVTLYAEWKTPYEAWLNGATPTDANLREFAFGTANTGAIVLDSDGKITTRGQAPIIQTTVGSALVQLTYARLKNSGCAYRAEFSDSLGAWLQSNDPSLIYPPDVPTEVIVDNGDDMEMVSVKFPIFRNNGGSFEKMEQNFCRIAVTAN